MSAHALYVFDRFVRMDESERNTAGYVVVWRAHNGRFVTSVILLFSLDF